jgi:BioD-like phosphotransacetylase family protein
LEVLKLSALLVTSQLDGSGKTTIAAGIGEHLENSGKKVGYLRVGGIAGGLADAAFVGGALGIPEPPAKLQCDITAVKAAYGVLAIDKDTVIIEGDWQSAKNIINATGAKVITVAVYADKKPPVNAADYKTIGDSLIGIVLNKVPSNRLEVASQFKEVKVLGVIPEDRTLLALSVGELADTVKGEILSGKDGSGELVENFMLGITGLDRNPAYFDRKEAKAAILPTGRYDLQLAALATPTACLVLTGAGEISPSVLAMAEAKKVPVIRTADETPAVVEAVETALNGGRMAQPAKLARLAELMNERFDFSAQ